MQSWRQVGWHGRGMCSSINDDVFGTVQKYLTFWTLFMQNITTKQPRIPHTDTLDPRHIHLRTTQISGSQHGMKRLLQKPN